MFQVFIEAKFEDDITGIFSIISIQKIPEKLYDSIKKFQSELVPSNHYRKDLYFLGLIKLQKLSDIQYKSFQEIYGFENEYHSHEEINLFVEYEVDLLRQEYIQLGKDIESTKYTDNKFHGDYHISSRQVEEVFKTQYCNQIFSKLFDIKQLRDLVDSLKDYKYASDVYNWNQTWIEPNLFNIIKSYLNYSEMFSIRLNNISKEQLNMYVSVLINFDNVIFSGVPYIINESNLRYITLQDLKKIKSKQLMDIISYMSKIGFQKIYITGFAYY